jgi:hypothetical protein
VNSRETVALPLAEEQLHFACTPFVARPTTPGILFLNAQVWTRYVARRFVMPAEGEKTNLLISKLVGLIFVVLGFLLAASGYRAASTGYMAGGVALLAIGIAIMWRQIARRNQGGRS